MGDLEMTITERARAKINLTLRVLGRRADGYHTLESLIVFADVGDDVRFHSAAPTAVRMHGRFSEAIAGDNLIDTTLSRLAIADPGLTLGSVEVEKLLPIAAGIGGGSADAAAVLRAVRCVNPASAAPWDDIAARLGADVTVCLANRSSFVWGVGERIAPVSGLPLLHAVLVCPMGAAPMGKTRAVFSQLSLPPSGPTVDPAPLPPFADVTELLEYMRSVGNDLNAPALAVMPACAEVEAALTAVTGCLYVALSGAGPTSFGIFADADSARAAASSLQAQHPEWWVAPVVLGE